MTARILVVDDDPDMLALLGAALKSSGYDVDTFLDGSKAVQTLASRDYDVLLADLNMPGVTGMDVLDATRQLSPDTVAVVVTTRNSIDSAVSSLKAGAFDFLSKPVDILDLLRVVRRAVEHRQRRLSSNIQQATSAVFSTLEPRDLPPTLVELSVDVLAADYALLLGYVPTGDTFEVLFESGDESQARIGHALWTSIGRVVTRELEPLLLPAESSKVAGVAGLDGVSVIAAPLVIRNQLFGVLAVSRRVERPFGRLDLERLSILAAQAVLAMDNAHLIERLRDRINALERARTKLTTNEALEGIGQLATGLAHQLQAPASALQTHLRAAVSELSALPNDEEETRQLAERLQYALEAAQRIGLVAGDLSRLSRSREDVLFELGHAVEAAVRMGGARVTPQLQCDLQSVQVRGNPGQLSQAVLQLLVNASLAITDEASQQVKVRIYAERGQAVLVVEDTGRGMSAEQLEDAFTPFSTYWPESMATGLGLSTCREIIERHDGILELTSVEGTGTAATVRLPAAAEDDDLLFAFGEA